MNGEANSLGTAPAPTTVKKRGEKKPENYSPALTREVIAAYAEVGNEGLDEMAKRFGKSKRSLISKLSREKVYVKAEPKQRKTPKDEGPAKKQLLASIEGTGFDPEGLEGANKAALQRLLTRLSGEAAESEAA